MKTNDRPNLITPHQPARLSALVQNALLTVAGLLTLAPLSYQLPRWTKGLDPTFVHPNWMKASTFPFVLHMAKIHPVIWITALVVIFIWICRNYGWKLEK